jgi:hypothetical protein
MVKVRTVMTAQYLLRFDDIYPEMNWRVWAEIEPLLVEKDIKPILAIVPDNQDRTLRVHRPAPDFWKRVRSWQERGWTIGLHGHQHVYLNKNPGILGLPTLQSEFAGLPREVQEEKLRSGLAIFDREGVRADCWVAPSHSFDWITVDLLAGLGVKVISDGLWPWPHTDRHEVTWIPQQLWAAFRPMPSGVWTVCYHHKNWCQRELEGLRCDLDCFALQITSVDEVLRRFTGRQQTLYDWSYAWFNLSWNHHLRPALSHLVRRISYC